ncbi:secreted protein [Fulvivirga imtechensis AK7]|uniref:Secreted protein n=1 Tax=Fulvivirga imtechensis AK7 TaxID=1237149 RepID=L8JSY7_9BACT|nr:alpha/beta hydrolase [Fulvivirga imtechensis]ELR71965.1 secreted protein [Fulvivirga imtechensis AK7]
MKNFLSVICLVFCVGVSFGQNYEKVVFNNEPGDGYYLAIAPESTEISGVLVLLPGFGQTAESIFPETKIHNVAYLHGILTIAVAGGRKLYADEEVMTKLNATLEHVKERYNLSRDQFVIGGFSAGGTISLRYAEYCYERPQEASIQPKGVFSVDSPVDLFNIWDYFQREIKKNYSEAGVGEANFVSEIMLREIGHPVKNKATYDKLTPFNADLDEPGNERFLKDVSVRVYHDIDVIWLLQNRRRSLFDSNALAASELINRLLLAGNEKAEFVPAKQPGFRSAGFRHPHSWSIVDEVELVLWVSKNLRE